MRTHLDTLPGPALILPIMLALVSALGASTVHAATPACDHGAWRGTLGGTPVSIELTEPEGDRPASGRYYYRASVGDLTLVHDPKTGEWQELDDKERLTGRLRLACDEKTLSGEWRSADDAKRLPIAATVLGTNEYNAARKSGVKPKVEKRGELGGRRFEELSYDTPGGIGTNGKPLTVSQGGLRLLGETRGIAAVNAALHEQAVDALAEHLDCRAQGRRDRGPGAGYESSLTQKLLAWNSTFAVVEVFSEGYCGGAHPWHGNWARTYRLDTGAQAEVTTWLKPEFREVIAKDSTLGRLLMKTYQRNGGSGQEVECRDEISWYGGSVHPAPRQLVFQGSTSYAMSPCAEDVALPIDVALPFLSPEGREAIKSFR